MYPNELDRDAVGLWEIVADGKRGFGLIGPGLVEFVRHSLLQLFERGARPVEGDTSGKQDWRLVERYGSRPAEMADKIIAEWQSSDGDPTFGDVWFALPDRL